MLDGIRGIAALAVLVFHARLDVFASLDRAYLMVDLFFLLSGFVLTLAFEQRLRDGLSWHSFMWKRCRRLWPVIAAGVAIGAACFAILLDSGWGARNWVMSIAMALLLIPTLWTTRGGALFPLNRPHWSLFFEVLANLIHALVLVRLGTRALCVLLALIAPALAYAAWLNGDLTFGAFQNGWYFGLLRVGYSYIAGIILARLWQQRERRAWLPWYAVLALPLAVLLAIELPPVWLGDVLAVVAAFPVIIWLGTASPVPPTARPALAALGALSYPLYAVHWPVLTLMENYAPSTAGKVAAMGLAIAIAAATAFLLDRTRLMQRLRESRTRPAPSANSSD